jgi:hypothetical protein
MSNAKINGVAESKNHPNFSQNFRCSKRKPSAKKMTVEQGRKMKVRGACTVLQFLWMRDLFTLHDALAAGSNSTFLPNLNEGGP